VITAPDLAAAVLKTGISAHASEAPSAGGEVITSP
jgi:hypothetical protein